MEPRTLKLFELLFILLTGLALEIHDKAHMRRFYGSYLSDKIETISRIHKCREDGIIIIALAFLFQEVAIVIPFYTFGLLVILVSPERTELENYLWPVRIITNKVALLFIAAFASTFDASLNGFISISAIRVEYLRYGYALIIVILFVCYFFIGWRKYVRKR